MKSSIAALFVAVALMSVVLVAGIDAEDEPDAPVTVSTEPRFGTVLGDTWGFDPETREFEILVNTPESSFTSLPSLDLLGTEWPEGWVLQEIVDFDVVTDEETTPAEVFGDGPINLVLRIRSDDSLVLSKDTFINATFSSFSALLPDGFTTTSAFDLDGEIFRGSETLVSIDLTAVKNVADGAFSGCTALKQIQWGQKTVLGTGVFEDSSLETVNLSSYHGESVPARSFANCTLLSYFQTAGSLINTIGESAFEGDALLTTGMNNGELDLSRFRTVEANAFKGCTSIKVVKFATDAVETVVGDGAFQNCIGIERLVLNDDVTVDIGKRSFAGCTSLYFTEHPRNVSRIMYLGGIRSLGDGAFSGCTSINQVEFGERLGKEDASIGADIFSGCSSLTIFNFGTSVKTVPQNMFRYNTVLTQVMGPAVTDIGDRAFDRCTSLTFIGFDSLQRIGTAAFYGTRLTSVSFGEVVSLSTGAFADCTMLATVNLPKLVTVGQEAFADDVLLSAFIAPQVTSVGNEAFTGCRALQEISLEKVTSIGQEAFSGCSALKSVYLSAINSLGYRAFMGCTSLTSIDLNDVRQMQHDSFQGCTSLTTLEFGRGSAYVQDAPGGPVYNAGHTVLFMMPPGTRGEVTSVDPRVTLICLDGADVTFFLDMDSFDSGTPGFETIGSSGAKAFLYSMQSLSSAVPSVSGNTFTLRCTPLSGWTLDRTHVKVTDFTGSQVDRVSVSGNAISFTYSAHRAYVVLPFGTECISPSDLTVSEVDGWRIEVPDGWLVYTTDPDTGSVAQIQRFECNVVGYTGTGAADLPHVFDIAGTSCRIVNVVADSSLKTITELDVASGPVLGDGLFEYSTALRSVDIPAESVSERLFRYCTGLEDVTLRGSGIVASNAFEGCTSLGSITSVATSLTFGRDALLSSGVGLIKVSDGSVQGSTVPVVHYSGTADLAVEGNALMMANVTTGSVVYSYVSGGECTAAKVYADHVACIPLDGRSEVYLEDGTGTRSDMYLVVLDPSMEGMSVSGKEVEVWGTVGDAGTPKASGYTFLRWESSDGTVLSPNAIVDSSGYYHAVWAKDGSKVDATLPVALIAVVGTVLAVLMMVFISRRL